MDFKSKCVYNTLQEAKEGLETLMYQCNLDASEQAPIDHDRKYIEFKILKREGDGIWIVTCILNTDKKYY